MNLSWLKSALRSRYVAQLEDDLAQARDEIAREREMNDRLRAENRALWNSLLGTAGIPPVEMDDPNKAPREIPRVRRRSWHQLQLAHELEESRQAVTLRQAQGHGERSQTVKTNGGATE